MRLRTTDLDRRVTFERKAPRTAPGQAGQEVWIVVAEKIPAQVRGVLPSRAETTDDGLPMASLPARVRIRWRSDITADMRIVFEGRVLQIVSGPAEIGRREGLEMMAVTYSTDGGAA